MKMRLDFSKFGVDQTKSLGTSGTAGTAINYRCLEPSKIGDLWERKSIVMAGDHKAFPLFPCQPEIREQAKPLIDKSVPGVPSENDHKEQRILTWLRSIGEDDPVTIGEVIDAIRRDPDALQYFLTRSNEIRVSQWLRFVCANGEDYLRDIKPHKT